MTNLIYITGRIRVDDLTDIEFDLTTKKDDLTDIDSVYIINNYIL